MRFYKFIKRDLKWLLHASKGVKWRIFANIFLGLIRILAAFLFIYFSKEIIDTATISFSENRGEELAPKMLWLAVSLILLKGLQISANILESYLTVQTEIRMKNNLRLQLFDHLIMAKWSGSEDFHTGDLINRLEEDVRVISATICRIFHRVFLTIINLVVAFIILCSKNYMLAIGLLIIMPFFLILSRIYISRVKKITTKIRNTDSKIQSKLQESILHRSLIQSMEKEGFISSAIDDSQGELYDQTMERTRFSVFARIMTAIGFTGGYLAVFLYSVWKIKSGQITFGDMTAFLQLVNHIQGPTVELNRQFGDIIHSTVSIERLIELQNIPSEKQRENRILKGVAGIRFSDVTFRYPSGKRDILRNFTYDFKPGTANAIIGETGSGKSTAIRLMLALLDPQKGKIEIYNNNGESYIIDNATRGNIAYIPQGNSLLSGTIRENLLLGDSRATEEDMYKVLHTAAADFVNELSDGLDTKTMERGVGLSEGQAQRIAIARGLLRPGSIMILDEFSSSLDPATEEVLIKRLINDYNEKTMIFVTHREKIVEYCSNVVKLERLNES